MAEGGEESKIAFKTLYRHDLNPVKIDQIPIEDKYLKLLAEVPCSVAMYRFNVLNSMEEKVKKQAKASGKSISAKRVHKDLVRNGYSYYKIYYQPRERWFQEQRIFAQHLRQFKHLDTLIKIKIEKEGEIFISPKKITKESSIDDLQFSNGSSFDNNSFDPDSNKLKYDCKDSDPNDFKDDLNSEDFHHFDQEVTSTQN